MLLSVPQRLYQSPGPHTPWGCVAAINAASQTERFVVSSISTYVGVGSNISTNDGALKKAENVEDSQAAAADSNRTLRRSGRQRRGPVTIHDELLSEKLEQLRRSRSGHAGDVKRKHDAFRRMFEAGSITSAKVAFAELCSAFNKFVHRHRECVALAPGSETETHFLALSAVIDKSRADLTHLIDSGYEAPAMSGLSVNPENPHELGDVGPSELVREYEVNLSDLPQVDPVDIVSQRGWQHSGSSTSTSSALVRAAAKQASHIAKARYIKQQQELERDQIKLRASMDLQSKDNEHRLANLQLQGEIRLKRKH